MALQDNALVTLQQVKDRLGITVDTQDDYLESLINSNGDDFESYCNRIFRELTVTNYELKGTNRQEIVLPQRPITAISSIKIDDVTLETKADDEYGGYYLIPDTMGREGYTGKVGRQMGWLSSGYVNNPLEYTPDQDFKTINIVVTYTGGYATIPADLQKAALAEIEREYNYEADGYKEVTSEGVQSAKVVYDKRDINTDTAWTARTMRTLRKYCQIAVM